MFHWEQWVLSYPLELSVLMSANPYSYSLRSLASFSCLTTVPLLFKTKAPKSTLLHLGLAGEACCSHTLASTEVLLHFLLKNCKIELTPSCNDIYLSIESFLVGSNGLIDTVWYFSQSTATKWGTLALVQLMASLQAGPETGQFLSR